MKPKPIQCYGKYAKSLNWRAEHRCGQCIFLHNCIDVAYQNHIKPVSSCKNLKKK